MRTTTPSTEVALAEKIAASVHQLLTLLAELDDPETLIGKATRLEAAGNALYLEVLDTGELPITTETLIAAVRERLPEQLRVLVGTGRVLR
ncbi:hypothetical protein [Nocardia pseudovaccinii]|uniref:hypothetical protein n=1 Tax=Nocardia pseudovaccinii TaxID=189540 RepID=UPI0007A5071F|nr:hypothetical protein [Nocardia pseudovaccinii]